MLLSTTVKQTLMRPLQGVLCRTLAGEPEILMKTECPGPKSKAIMEDLDSLQSMKRWVSSTPFGFNFVYQFYTRTTALVESQFKILTN